MARSACRPSGGRMATRSSTHPTLKDIRTCTRSTWASGSRNRLAGYPGLNTGADISPNGREIALILSKDGNPELYVKNLRSGQLTRLTSSPRAAEASPSWSPDGNRIVYVSTSRALPSCTLFRATAAGRCAHDEPRVGERGPGLGRQRLDRLHDAGGRPLPGLRHGPEYRRCESRSRRTTRITRIPAGRRTAGTSRAAARGSISRLFTSLTHWGIPL